MESKPMICIFFVRNCAFNAPTHIFDPSTSIVNSTMEFFLLFLFPGGGSVSGNITFDILVAKGSYSCNNFTTNDFNWYNFSFFFSRHGYNISICRLLYPNSLESHYTTPDWLFSILATSNQIGRH